MALQHVFVISDLHLGGAPGFQLCSPAGRAHLCRFIGQVAERLGVEAHLVIAGDFVDFLAEEPFLPFTQDESQAARKLDQALRHAEPVFEALRALLQRGAALTLLLGNHDIELSLPRVRRRLLERLGPGRVDFVYDNQALALGPVLIEHGHRYDTWNAVQHDELRRLRSALSRREGAPAFAAPPGSELVARIMNPLKGRYAFIDLLKPEDAAVPPLLAFLEPGLITDLRRIYEMARISARRGRVDLDAAGYRAIEPEGAPEGDGEHLAEELAARGPGAEAEVGERGLGGAWDFLKLWQMSREQKGQREGVLRQLRKALRAYAAAHEQAFDIGQEITTYLDPARAAIERGFEVVIYGHTHLVKRVELPRGRYLNTGTWGDLMRLPASVLAEGEDEGGMEELAALADDIAGNRLGRWRRQVATYAYVLLGEDGTLRSADVACFSEAGEGVALDDGVQVWR